MKRNYILVRPRSEKFGEGGLSLSEHTFDEIMDLLIFSDDQQLFSDFVEDDCVPGEFVEMWYSPYIIFRGANND